ncbi:hypothetical protein GB928_027675 [Shinella curvata]|uniref:Uncharacterized protein n=1 Tax=Shinella curvata TaxID=1817964 RepID=A0ABT8XNG4_9HYPH|nr:hypothetical protein [Shinella curvata]MCJ8057185.1 hypothetical protein [Shinella curvata]MDO6124968.1 hypothetical protein [Shinella curvata]
MNRRVNEWSRAEGERRIREVLDSAKQVGPQAIRDVDGLFEVRFIASTEKESAGEFLARGGPDSQ